MRAALLRFGSWTAAALLFLLLLAECATWFKHWQEVDSISDEQKIARTLEIIRTSTPANHKVLKVLFYGQSITKSGWHNAVVEHWRQKYPNTVFVVQNRALGGFPSQALVRTAGQDIAAFYPDLIVFHVYGDHRAYEKIIRLFRSRSAADIIVQTDHGEVLPDPPCAEGLQLTLHAKPGCLGRIWARQRLWNDWMSYHEIPTLAKKYGLALEPQRLWWRDYLLRTHIPPQSLLIDTLHPNEQGKALIAEFFNRYFDNLVENWSGQIERNVLSIPENITQQSTGSETVNFDGARLELIANKPIATWPAVTIDGSSPKEIDGCYQVTRASTVSTVPDWPAIRRITLLHDHIAEDWTAILTNIASDQSAVDFKVKGSVTGDDGEGDSNHDFISKSGRLSIEAEDWLVEPAFDLSHIRLQVPFEVHWSVSFACGAEPEVIDLGNGQRQYRYVFATGLPDAKHTAKLVSPANGLADISEFRAYQPPLHQE